MQVNLTRPAARKMSALLDEGLCTRAELIEHLTTYPLPDLYTLAPHVTPDEDGYVICPWRTENCGDIATSERAEAVLRDLAERHHLSPEKRSRESTSMALDAILSGTLILPPTLALHPPRIIHHDSTQRPKLALSNEALVGISRLSRSYLPISTSQSPDAYPGDSSRNTVGHDARQHNPYRHLSKMIGTLGQFHFMWADPNHKEIRPHLRRYFMCSLPSQLIEHFAREGSNLGVPPLSGGRRTTLSLASNTLEAIGQGVIVPERLRAQLTRIGLAGEE